MKTRSGFISAENYAPGEESGDGQSNNVNNDEAASRSHKEEEGYDWRAKADTIMGFGKHAHRTYLTVINYHYDYVTWAEYEWMKQRGDVGYGLQAFLDWVHVYEAWENEMNNLHEGQLSEEEYDDESYLNEEEYEEEEDVHGAAIERAEKVEECNRRGKVNTGVDKRNGSMAALVTPEKTKKPRHIDEGENTNIAEDLFYRDDGEEEEEDDEDEGEAAKEEKEEQVDDSNQLTAETVMGFGRHRYDTYRMVMTQDYQYVKWVVQWVKSLDTDVNGKLNQFLEWFDSPEGRFMEMEAARNQIFTYGLHKGLTFEHVARCDPTYHSRYMYCLELNGPTLDEEMFKCLIAYITWYDGTKSLTREDRIRFNRLSRNNATSAIVLSASAAPSTVSQSTSKSVGTVNRSYTEAQVQLIAKVLAAKETGGRRAHYCVLGLAASGTQSSESEIKKAYRTLALKLHPDKNSAPYADEAFKAVGLAYATVSDPVNKRQYDMTGH